MLENSIPHIYSYGMIATILTAAIYFIWNLRKESIPKWHLFLSTFLIIMFTLLGARLMWSLEVPNITLTSIFEFRFGGFRLLGGVVFALLSFIIVFFIYKKYYNISTDKYVFTALGAALLSFAVAKFTCFLNGCCYGIETNLPWGMRFPDAGVKLRHPTQIYDTLALLFNFAVQYVLKNKISWLQKISLSIFLYVVLRMIIEPLRANATLFMNGPTWPIYYVLLIACVIIFVIDMKKKNKKDIA